MGESFHIDHVRRTVFFSFEGALAGEELLRTQEAWVTHEDFDPEYNRLVDLRRVSRPGLSTSCIHTLAIRANIAPPAKYAIVAPQDLLFGLARMFDILANDQGKSARVFREMADAYSWLGLDSAES